MSLSLSNSLSFALIPLVKIGENSKKSYFFILEVQFHHEGGPIQHRYLELFLSAWSIFSPIFTKGIKAKLNELESESDIFP